MMKIVNSIYRVFLVGCILMLLVVPINAEENTEASLSVSLTDNEISLLEELSMLDPTHNDIDGEIVSVSKLIVKQEYMESLSHYSTDDMIPLGPIGTNYMTMYVTVTRLIEAGYDKFQLYSYFRWDKTPFFQLTDGMHCLGQTISH